MRNYIDISNYYPNYIEYGDIKIEKLPNNVTVNQDFIDFHNGADLVNQSNYFFKMSEVKRKGPIMTNNDYSLLANKYFLDNAVGDILIVGLGLGFVVFPLLNDPTVTSIKIIDDNPDIINYVGNVIKNNDINNKVTILQSDVKNYYQVMNNETYDFIYIDYFRGYNDSVYSDIDLYKTSYIPFKKNSDSIIYCLGQDIRHLILGT